MARRRLTVPDPARLAERFDTPVPEIKSMPGVAAPSAAPPIARVAGDTAAQAALAELSGEITRARDEGRLIQAVPLEAIDESYLVRDRIGADEDELAALMQSLAARGQQVPIEVVALEADATGKARFGLITGWRRLTALRRLRAESTDSARFATVLALLRRPDTAADAYLAMIEENEIRVGLSYYERARIVARAAERGVFPDAASALSHLFASASRAKRSKIGSFLRIHAALDDRLQFPSAIPERLGLALVKALDADPAFAETLRARLDKTAAGNAQEEIALLENALKPTAAKPRPTRAPAVDSMNESAWREQVTPGIRMSVTPGRIVLDGPDVTALLQSQLFSWLRDG